jgi:hypothetical protein
MAANAIVCPACGRRYAPPDNLLSRRQWRVRCPACGRGFRLILPDPAARTAQRSTAVPAPAAAPATERVEPPATAAPAPEARPPRRRADGDPARRAIREILAGQEQRRDRALASHRLLLEFGREIGSAWRRYLAASEASGAERTAAFRDALNEILANGKPLF